MDVKQSLQNVADAWDRVFDDVADLGRQLAKDIRSGYQSRSDAEAAFETEAEAKPDTTAQAQATVRAGLDAAKSAFSQLAESLTEGRRGEALGRETEAAVRTSLAELGALFTGLSEKLRPVEPGSAGSSDDDGEGN